MKKILTPVALASFALLLASCSGSVSDSSVHTMDDGSFMSGITHSDAEHVPGDSHVMEDGSHMDGAAHPSADHVMGDGTSMSGATHSENGGHMMDDVTESQ